MIVAEYLLRFLEDLGVRELFGIPGYASIPLYVMAEKTSIRPVLCKHEEGAAFMAYGFAMSGAGVAACTGTSGAASVHLLAGLAAAYANSVPVVAITGQVERWKMGRAAFQEMTGRSPRSADMAAMFRACTVWSGEARTPEEIPFLCARMAETLAQPRKGPVHLSVPVDILRMDVALAPWRHHVAIPPRSIVPETVTWSRILERIRNSQAPLFLLGRGCRSAKAELDTFLLNHGFPFATTIQAKGLALHDSFWNLGVLGAAGSPRANSWLAEHCDLLVAVGSSLNEFTSGGFRALPQEGLPVVRIDVDPHAFVTTPYAELCVVAHASEALRLLNEQEWSLPAGLVDEIASLRRRKPPYVGTERRFEREGSVAPMDVMDILAELCPANTQFVADSGNNALWAVHRLQLKGVQDFHIDINTGCMGSGVVSAVGLQTACPEAPVVSICGDGGAMMLGNEISTAVEYSLPVVWVVLNDGKLGMVRQALQGVFECQWECGFSQFDIAKWASSMGASSITACSSDDLAQGLRQAFGSRSGPLVIDVRLNDLYLPNVFGRMQRSPEEEALFQASRELRNTPVADGVACQI